MQVVYRVLAGLAFAGVIATGALAEDKGDKDDKDPNFSSRKQNPDGSSALTVGRKWETDWTAKVGVDLAVPGDPRMVYDPNRPLPVTKEQQSGAGWASVIAPPVNSSLGTDKLSLDAKVDPTQEQGKLGTTLSHSVPVGKDYAVTLQNGYAVTRTMDGANGTLPVGAAPPSEFWSTDRTLKFDVLSSGTSFAAGTTTSTSDNLVHRKYGAEQKLFGDVTVKGTVTDVGAPTVNKSITAGFKKTW